MSQLYNKVPSFCPLNSNFPLGSSVQKKTYKTQQYTKPSSKLSLYTAKVKEEEQMASLSHLACYTIKCSSNRDHHDPHKQKLSNIKINGNPSLLSTTKVDVLSHKNGAVSTTVAPGTENGTCIPKEDRQNIPTKKQFVDHYRQGLIIEEGVGYRQTVVIRSYEVGADKTATIESILNLLQVNTSEQKGIEE